MRWPRGDDQLLQLRNGYRVQPVVPLRAMACSSMAENNVDFAHFRYVHGSRQFYSGDYPAGEAEVMED